MLVSINHQGLANRIKSWLAATAKDSSARVYWPAHPELTCAFTSLFTNRVEVEAPGKREPIDTPFLTHKGKYDFQYHNTPQDVIDKYLPLVRNIRFHKSIIVHCKASIRQFSEETIGMAVRTWRCEPPPRNTKWPFNEKRFFAEIARLRDTYKRCYFTCDDQKLFDKMRDRYGDWIFFAQRRGRLGDKTNPKSVQDALVDMILLGQAPLIFYCNRSTFAEMAWWFGGCQSAGIKLPKEIHRN